jgi:hypothetical protein
MDLTNPEMWKQEWTAFTNAPFIMLAGIMVVGVAAWWLNGKMSEGEIAGLKAQMSAKDERLSLGVDKLAAAERDLEKLQKEFQNYKAEVDTKGRNASPAKVDAAIVRLTHGNMIVRSSLTGLPDGVFDFDLAKDDDEI